MRVGTFVLAAQFPGQGQGETLHRAVRSAEVAEEAGLDAVWLAEHHFVPYGVCPSAVTLAALLLGRTRRIRVGTAVSVLPTAHPVALGEQAALLHLTSGGRFTLGVGRGGPWVDLEVFGSGLRAYEQGFPNRSICSCAGCASPASAGLGERFAFREVAVVPRPAEILDGGPDDACPEVIVACTSPRSVRLAARTRAADAARDALRRRGEGGDGRAVARGSARGGSRAGAGRGGGPCVGGRRADRRPGRRGRRDGSEVDAGMAEAGA